MLWGRRRKRLFFPLRSAKTGFLVAPRLEWAYHLAAMEFRAGSSGRSHVVAERNIFRRTCVSTWWLFALAFWIVMETAICAAAVDSRRPEIYSSRTWQSRDGLPQDAIQALAQTPDGYLWIGSSGGLIRFDGIRFVSFTRDNTPALQDDSVLSLRVSRDGSLWIGTEGGGLLRYRDGAFQHFGPEAGLTNLFIRALYEDSRSTLWVGTYEGVFRLEGGRFVRIDNRPGIPPMNVYTICEDHSGRVLVGGLGLLIWDAGKVTTYKSQGKAADWMVNTVQTSKDGTLWIGTFAYLRRVPYGYTGDLFREELKVEVLGNTAERSKPSAARYHISAITETRDGNVWIGTWGQGVILVRNGELRRFRAPAFLPDDNIWALMEDKEGNLWVGTQNGLVRLNRRLATTVTLSDGRPVNILTIYFDAVAGKLWMISTAGQLFQLKGDALVRAALPADLAALPLRTVFRDRERSLWIGTDGHGSFRLAGTGFTRFGESSAPEFAPGSRVPYFIRAFCEDKSGALWVGDDSGLSRFGDGKFTWIAEVPHSIRAVMAGRAGDLWAGTDTGVFHLRNGQVLREPSLGPLSSEKVWALHEDAGGGVWFGTRGAGLFLLRQGKLTRFTTANGLPSNSIFSIIEDKAGFLWMSSPSGVFSVRRDELEHALADESVHPAVRLYGTSEGLSTKQMNGGVQCAGILAGDGELWFASSGGAARIQPGTVADEGPLPVVIEHVLANGREVPPAASIRLGPAMRDLEIHYTAIRLQSPERVRFRYRLEGYDTRWNDAGERRVAYYTNLPAGDYQFHLVAYDVNLPEKPAEAYLGLRLEPHFYQTPWFLGVCVLVAGAIAVLAYVLHLRQIRRRFAVVLEERGRLAREMHDTVIQGCVGVSTLLEAASSLQESSPAASGDLVERARSQIQLTIEDARRAVWKIREQSGSSGGLSSSLARMAERVGKETGIAVECTASTPSVAVAPETQHNLLLVAREAINNAVRHGAPTRVNLDLRSDQARLSLTIADDGTGFSADETPQGDHYGIVGMRERVESLGGHFTITSAPGKGTVVRVEVPWASAAPRKPEKAAASAGQSK